MNMKKKILALLLAAAMALSLAACSSGGSDAPSNTPSDTPPKSDAPAYPTKGISVICPWGAGGGTDSCLRAFSEAIGKQLGQTLTVDNRTGGGGIIGHQAIADADPDGYTIGMVTFELSTYKPLGSSELTYEDYDLLCRVNRDPATVTVNGTGSTLTGTVDEIAATDEVGAGGTLVRQVTILVNNPGVLSETSQGTASIGGNACAAGAAFTYASSAQITAKAAGDLDVLNVKEGDRVSVGQVIGVISEADLDTQIENARIALENAQLSLKNAQEKLDDYTITSTIDGQVIEKNLDVGDNINGMSSSGTTVTYPAVIYDRSQLTFEMDIDEQDISQIQVGQKVEITADALDGQSFTGVVDKININGTTASGHTSYPVTVLVDGSPEELYPGMNVSAKIIVEEVGNVLALPVEAVERGNTVLVATPECLDEKGNVVDITAAQERQVTLGRNDDNYIEIVDGLEEGEVILAPSPQGSNMMEAMMGMG